MASGTVSRQKRQECRRFLLPSGTIKPTILIKQQHKKILIGVLIDIKIVSVIRGEMGAFFGTGRQQTGKEKEVQERIEEENKKNSGFTDGYLFVRVCVRRDSDAIVNCC